MDAQGDLTQVSIHEKKLNATRLQNPSIRVIAKILRARASELSSNFCEQLEERPNLASALKCMGPFDTPTDASSVYKLCASIKMSH